MTDANPHNVASFSAFLQQWMIRQKQFLDELHSAQKNLHEDHHLRDLISRVLSHYEQYYQEKSRVLSHDIFLAFSPSWFTSLERCFLWIAGFKPGMVIHVANNVVSDLTDEQRVRMVELHQETKLEERAMNDELAKIQESLGASPLLEALKEAGGRHGRSRRRRREEEEGEREVIPENLKVALENLVVNADMLRMNTALKMVQILKPYQAMNVLIAVGDLHIRIRTWGLERDANSSGANG